MSESDSVIVYLKKILYVKRVSIELYACVRKDMNLIDTKIIIDFETFTLFNFTEIITVNEYSIIFAHRLRVKYNSILQDTPFCLLLDL